MTADAVPTIELDGLAVRVALDVPGAWRVERAPDWHVAFEHGAPPDLAGTAWTGDVSQGGVTWGRFGTRGDDVHVHLEGVGHLLACEATRRARIHPEGGAASSLWALRRLMPYLASLGGRTVLHAACARLPAGAVLFLAEARTGKSTLALALDAGGVPVLADDHVALDPEHGGFVAHASFGFVDVGEASRRRFRPDCELQGGKGSVPLRTARPRDAVPVARLAFLARGDGVGAAPLPAARAVARLLKEALFVADRIDPGGHAARLDAAVALTAAVPALTLTVPDGLDALAQALPRIPQLF